MRLSAIAPLVNAVLDPLFIFGFDLGVAGAAWATVVATAVAPPPRLARGPLALDRSILPRPVGPLRLDAAILRRIAFIGFPGTLEHLVRNIASFALVKLIAGFGAAVLSAYTTAMVLLMMLIFPGWPSARPPPAWWGRTSAPASRPGPGGRRGPRQPSTPAS
ncbi:MAG: hypothetical protein R3F43_02280 [bacterium]